MKKLIICTSVVICMTGGDARAAVSVYNCKTGTCTQNIAYSGASSTCDGYAMAVYPTYACQNALNCAYNADDIENSGVACHNGWCARTIMEWCDDYQYRGSSFSAEGLFDEACYDCPANGTCNGDTMYCDAGYYMVYLGKNNQVVETPALYMGCQKCPAGASGQNITSNDDARGIFECYATGGTDTSGTYRYTSGCYYDN